MENVKIKGVLAFVFQKDTLGHNRYWLTDLTLEESQIIPDIISVIDQMILGCEITDISNQSGVSYLDLPEFKNQEEENGSYYIHSGGDLYQDQNKNIIISFYVEVNTVVLEQAPCDDFSLISRYWCPVQKKRPTYPIPIITNIISARSLTGEEISSEGLSLFPNNNFRVGYCD